MKFRHSFHFYFFVCVFLYLLISLSPQPVLAQECDTSNIATLNLDALSRINDKCNEALTQMEHAVQPHVDALEKMEADIRAFQARIRTIEQDMKRKAAAIAQGEKELGGLLTVAGRRMRESYVRVGTWNPLSTFLSSLNVGFFLRVFAYQQAALNKDKKVITQTALSVKDLQEKKKTLETEQTTLQYLTAETDRRAASVRKLVAEATAYEAKLRGVIAAVTSAQQAILTARSGTFTTSVGDVPLPDDPNASPNFNPGFSPAFAGFSFGAYTHKKGMSQYGAKGRAESGQNYQQILEAYYGKSPSGKDTGGSIGVSGYGNLDFETTYLYGIAEMPSTFPREALKAQAIAARSYAYFLYKSQGKTICITQSCQVFSKSKSDDVPGEWKDAVNATRGQVIDGVTTFYSSTTGGYSFTSGWDTKCGNQGCWTGDAYEKIAGSPWFYKGWYTADYYNTSAKCGRSHPWLSQEEFADIINAWQVRKSGGDASRILPVTINSCPIPGASGNPYSMAELRDKGGFTSVSSVSVRYSAGGSTDTVMLVTNKGEVSIPGSEFKETFNLRAPGYISVRSSLFNIEKK